MMLAWLYHEQDFSRHCGERQEGGLEEGSFEVSAAPTGQLLEARFL